MRTFSIVNHTGAEGLVHILQGAPDQAPAFSNSVPTGPFWPEVRFLAPVFYTAQAAITLADGQALQSATVSLPRPGQALTAELTGSKPPGLNLVVAPGPLPDQFALAATCPQAATFTLTGVTLFNGGDLPMMFSTVVVSPAAPTAVYAGPAYSFRGQIKDQWTAPLSTTPDQNGENLVIGLRATPASEGGGEVYSLEFL